MKKFKMIPKPPNRVKRVENIELKLKAIERVTTATLQVLFNGQHAVKLDRITALLEEAQAARDRRWWSRIKVWLRRPAKEKEENNE